MRELRKARKLTQVSVARKLGINQDAAHGWSSATTCCCPRCAGRWRRWAVASHSSPGLPTVPGRTLRHRQLRNRR